MFEVVPEVSERPSSWSLRNESSERADPAYPFPLSAEQVNIVHLALVILSVFITFFGLFS